jgi:hypothetical protein
MQLRENREQLQRSVSIIWKIKLLQKRSEGTLLTIAA